VRGNTATIAVALLFAVNGSAGAVAETVAVLVREVAAFVLTLTKIVIVAFEPALIAPSAKFRLLVPV